MSKKHKSLKLLIVAALQLAVASSAFAQDTKLYWQEEGDILRANLDGSNVEGPFSAVNYITNFVVDTKNQRMFFKDNPSGVIYRSELDLSDPVAIFNTTPYQLTHMEYDGISEKLLLTDMTGDFQGRIFKMNPDGSNPELLYQYVPMGMEIGEIRSIKLHPISNRLFLRLLTTDGMSVGTSAIYEMNLSTGEINRTIAADPMGGGDMAISKDASRIFLVGGHRLIEIRAEDGQTTETIVSDALNRGDYSSEYDQLIVFGYESPRFIARVNPDGTNQENILLHYEVDLQLRVVEAYDGDADGTPDTADSCPLDPSKVQVGACGCGNVDTDSDADGTADCNDYCPSDVNKVQPGSCGCGLPDTDSNNTGLADCFVQDPALAQSIVVADALGATTYKRGVSSNLLSSYRALKTKIAESGIPGLQDELRRLRRALTRLKFIKGQKLSQKQFKRVLAKAEAAVADIQAALRAYSVF
jgi:hypothetical protein